MCKGFLETNAHISTLAIHKLYKALITLLHEVGWRKKTSQLSVKFIFDASNKRLAK